MSSKIDRLKALANEISSYEIERKKNLKRLKELFAQLKLSGKVMDFKELFDFKAINLSGISLNQKTIGKISEGKYAQIIAITYIEEDGKKRAKNISLGYFGRVENLDEVLKDQIVEFILRWRLEKSFMGVDRYRTLLKNFDRDET
ncbi:hypothetical protein [Hydrogenimonas cancrithermarum]|uniref:Uncharacterized protein n=1 Tax=Hydrogenimonas cancrithermarum TaxID=2993563 RepID=A0ABN6WST3_9BACT|nr:hypothetical protein [Hydrogenimonas cancrithermarum]BDY12043.1 hypothetical protein HCR_03550 [Hydrogenimonas cancrithermarum]